MNAISKITNPRLRAAAIGWCAIGMNYRGVPTAAASILAYENPRLQRRIRKCRTTELADFFLRVMAEEQRNDWIEEWDALEEWEWECYGD